MLDLHAELSTEKKRYRRFRKSLIVVTTCLFILAFCIVFIMAINSDCSFTIEGFNYFIFDVLKVPLSIGGLFIVFYSLLLANHRSSLMLIQQEISNRNLYSVQAGHHRERFEHLTTMLNSHSHYLKTQKELYDALFSLPIDLAHPVSHTHAAQHALNYPKIPLTFISYLTMIVHSIKDGYCDTHNEIVYNYMSAVGSILMQLNTSAYFLFKHNKESLLQFDHNDKWRKVTTLPYPNNDIDTYITTFSRYMVHLRDFAGIEDNSEIKKFPRPVHIDKVIEHIYDSPLKAIRLRLITPYCEDTYMVGNKPVNNVFYINAAKFTEQLLKLMDTEDIQLLRYVLDQKQPSELSPEIMKAWVREFHCDKELLELSG